MGESPALRPWLAAKGLRDLDPNHKHLALLTLSAIE
jgi:hypothetical protein